MGCTTACAGLLSEHPLRLANRHRGARAGRAHADSGTACPLGASDVRGACARQQSRGMLRRLSRTPSTAPRRAAAHGCARAERRRIGREPFRSMGVRGRTSIARGALPTCTRPASLPLHSLRRCVPHARARASDAYAGTGQTAPIAVAPPPTPVATTCLLQHIARRLPAHSTSWLLVPL